MGVDEDAGATIAHKAIGFLLSYDEVSCVIPGIRSRAQLEANLEPAALAGVR
jgi:aryl-alcohol dehydrogenase-like predicted oxidoreductase